MPQARAQTSGVATRVPASGKVRVEDYARPSQFAHTDFGGIVGAGDPGLQVVEMVAQREMALL
jgi:hypothetical protein